MKAVRLHVQGDPASLRCEEVPSPRPGAGEVLIRVHAGGVTPSELSWFPTSHNKEGENRALPVLGHEFSGVIAAVGEGVERVSVGDAAYGMNDWFADGAMAEYCISRPEWIAPKPGTLDHVQAAAVPIGALTAWQGLFDRAGLQRGQTLLVHGGAGAVGTFVVQLGRWCGARVIATASAQNRDFVRELGAAEAIDYRARPFDEVVHDIDVVFDAVGGDTLARSWNVLKKDGRLVTITSSSEGVADPRTRSAFFIVEPNRAQLVRIAELIDAGHLRPYVDAVFPIERAVDAVATRDRSRPHRGKVVLRVAASAGAT